MNRLCKLIRRWREPSAKEVPRAHPFDPILVERLLPVHCYARSPRLQPVPLAHPRFIIEHFFSAINVKPDDPYNVDVCWRLFRDLNFPPALRLHDIYDGPRVQCSTHFFIARDGTIYQFVPMQFIAWHAGLSKWDGLEDLNSCSFGIENAGSVNVPFTYEQYESNARLCAWLMRLHPVITLDRILGHEQVAWPRGRKHDPGHLFDWDLLYRLIKDEL